MSSSQRFPGPPAVAPHLPLHSDTLMWAVDYRRANRADYLPVITTVGASRARHGYCQLCSETFESKDGSRALERHMETERHIRLMAQYLNFDYGSLCPHIAICPICNKQLVRGDSLSRHTKNCTPAAPETSRSKPHARSSSHPPSSSRHHAQPMSRAASLPADTPSRSTPTHSSRSSSSSSTPGGAFGQMPYTASPQQMASPLPHSAQTRARYASWPPISGSTGAAHTSPTSPQAGYRRSTR